MPGNLFLKVLLAAASGVAWLFAGFFVLIGFFAYLKKKRARHSSDSLLSRPLDETADIATPSPEAERAKETAVGSSPAAPPVRTLPAGRGPLGEPLERPVDEMAQAQGKVVKHQHTSGDNSLGALLGMPGTMPPKNPDQASEAEEKPGEWSLALIRRLEWKRFEDLCQRYYACRGMRSETTPLGPDGGIDIRVYHDDPEKPASIVQCKAWGERMVGVRPIRELLGVMTHEKIGRGVFMTSGRYSEEARLFAGSNRITLVDGVMLLMMIQRLPAEAQGDLLAFAVAGDYDVPSCPGCGVKMRAVPAKPGRAAFWGCVNFPGCRQVLNMRRESAAA